MRTSLWMGCGVVLTPPPPTQSDAGSDDEAMAMAMKAELEGNGKGRVLLKQSVTRHLGGGSSGSQWCRDNRFVAAWMSTFEQLGIHINLPAADPKPAAPRKRKKEATAAATADDDEM